MVAEGDGLAYGPEVLCIERLEPDLPENADSNVSDVIESLPKLLGEEGERIDERL